MSLYPTWIRLAPGLRIARLPDGRVRIQAVTNDGETTHVQFEADVSSEAWVDGVTGVSSPSRLDVHADRELVRVEVNRIHHGGRP